MGSKTYKWHKIATSAEDIRWTAGHIAEVEVDGKKLCIGRCQNEWYGFAHTCPHAGAPMLDAYIGGGCQVTCPVHSLKFNLKTGRDVNGEGYTLKTYPVEVRPDGVYLGIEERSGGFLSRWF